MSEIDSKKKTIPNENHCDLSKRSLGVEERVPWTFRICEMRDLTVKSNRIGRKAIHAREFRFLAS